MASNDHVPWTKRNIYFCIRFIRFWLRFLIRNNSNGRYNIPAHILWYFYYHQFHNFDAFFETIISILMFSRQCLTDKPLTSYKKYTRHKVVVFWVDLQLWLITSRLKAMLIEVVRTRSLWVFYWSESTNTVFLQSPKIFL